MGKPLGLFLPPDDFQGACPSSTRTPIKTWCVVFAVMGAFKVFQCLPFSLGIGSQAHAGAAVEPLKHENKATKEDVKEPPVEPNPIPLPIGLDEMKILQALRERSAELKSTSVEQEQRQKDMEMLNQIMKKNINELTQLKDLLDAQAKNMEKEPQEALQKMAKLYDGMKPAQCAKILEDMETPIVAQIIGLMKKQVAAGVMAALSDKKARLVTLQSLQMKQPQPLPQQKPSQPLSNPKA